MRATGSKTSRRIADLHQLESARVERCVDLQVAFKRRETGEELQRFGGRWDRIAETYLAERSKRGKVFWLNEAQCLGERGRSLADGPIAHLIAWMEARASGSSRVIELVFDGARGSGKSHLGILAVFAIAIAFPGARCLLVSPANTRLDELEIIVKSTIPIAWRSVFSERKLTYYLPNGSTIKYIGADDENALKQGGFEVALLNEAQLMTSTAYAHAIAGVRNVAGRPAGLLILAMNYASKERGEWTNDHLDNIEAKRLNARHIKLDPELNINIQEGVLSDIEQAVRSVRPDLADTDSLGIRKRLGEMATPAFRPHSVELGGHVGRPPVAITGIDGVKRHGWTDVTRQLTAEKLGTEHGFAYVVGADFQKRPGCVASIGKLYRRPDGKVVFVFEHIIVAGDNEDDLARRIDEWLGDHGYTARDALVVADSSGRTQNAAHTSLTKPSHAILQEWFFTVVGPAKVKVNGKLGKRNPDVDDSLAQFYDLCTEERILVYPEAEWLIESLRRCKIKKRGGSIRLDDSHPGYSHPVDTVRYVTWYFEPRRGPTQAPLDRDVAGELRRIRLFTSQ